MCLIRHSIVQRLITALLLPFVLVAMNGTGFAWAIYEWEWVDILTHHYQMLDPNDENNKAFGRGYMREILDKDTEQDSTLPKPPVVIQELQAILTTLSYSHHAHLLTRFLIPPCTEGAPILGFFADIFRPPTIV